MIKTINVTNPPKRKVFIGHYGEHEFRQVIFDVTDWKEQFPDGEPLIVFKRADGDIYPIVPTVNSDGNPVFIPTNVETAAVGDCMIQLRWMSGDVVGKSCNIVCCVESAIGDYGDVPADTAQDWIDRIVAASEQIVGDAQDAADAAQSAATAAEGSASSAASAASQAASSASDAASSAAQAAENAQQALEAANLDLETDAEEGKMYITVDGVRQGSGAAGGGTGGGLSFDGGAFERIDEDGNVSENYYLHLKTGDDDIEGFTPIEVPPGMGGGGGGGGGGSTMVVRSRMPAKSFSIMDTVATLPILYTWSSVDDTSQEPTGDGVASWFVNGTRVARQTVAQGDGSFDIRRYLLTGQVNNVKLTIDDDYGTSRSYTWSVNVTAYTLTWNAPDMEDHGAPADYALRLVASGTGDKTVVVRVDGETEVYRQVVSSSGRTTSVTVPASLLTHGSHVIEAWMEVTVEGETISTDPLRHVGIWRQAGSVIPVVAILDDEITMTQLETYGIKYMVYDPAQSPTDAELLVDGTTVTTVSVGRDEQTWAYRANESGNKVLGVRCGVTTATVNVTIEDLGYDIAPITNGLAVDLDPSGHSNSEANRNQFGYKDANGTNHPLLYSNGFDWTNGGFHQDEDGVTAFVVRRGDRAQLDRSIFADNAKSTGKHVELIFKTVNSRDYDAEIMSCFANNIGIKMYANNGYMRCDTTSVDMMWCEEQKVELCFSVEPTSGKRRMEIWDAGTPGKGKQYVDTSIWMQADPEFFTFGSDDADVWIYRMRVYDNYLTDDEVLANFIADAPTPAIAVERYLRNSIYTDDGGSISIQRLINAAQNLHVFEIKTGGFPKDKKNGVPCRIEHWMGAGGAAHHWWTDENAKFVLQGTSSLNYIESCGNLDLDMRNAVLTNENGETMADGYAMTDKSIPVKYLNAKANTASSDNCNNTISAELYNKYDPLVPLAKVLDPRVRDTVEGHPVAVFVTNTSDTAFKCGGDLAREIQPGETILYLAGDINNSKKNEEVFGITESLGTDPDGVPAFCMEFMDNGYERCLYHSADFTQETWKNSADNTNGQFEFRYGDETDAQKQKFIAMQNWVVSLRPDDATNRNLAQAETLYNPATGLNETFVKDTATYRGCKFRNEVANWFSVDNLVYYYVFTTFFCGVDQRSKNTFCSYEPDEDGNWRFNYRMYYDGDTICGINNKGALTLTYGVEDTDIVGDGYAFNAHDSTLWCLVRDYLPDRCTAEYSRLESAGLFDETTLNSAFDTHQRIRPEALMVEDFRNKYDGPLLRNGTTTYYESMHNGEKKSQRHQFFHFQLPYMSSKYQSASARNESLLMNAYSPSGGAVPAASEVTITPYCDLYLTLKCDNFGTATVRAKKGVPTKVGVYDSGGNPVALNDTATQIFKASWISAFDSLAQFYAQQFSGSTLKKLRRLPLGSSVSGYSNKNLTALGLTGLPMIEYLNICGLTNLETSIDLSGCPFLEEIYATGSGITGIKLARGAAVRVLQLPAVTSLIALDLHKLTAENFSINPSRLSLIHVEDSDGVNTQSIIESTDSLAYIRMTDVNWSMSFADAVMKLIGKTGLDENSNPGGSTVLTGAAFIEGITEGEHSRLRTAFPNLAITYSAPYLEAHTVTFKNYDGSTLKLKDGTDAVFTVRYGGSIANPVNSGLMDTPVRPDTAETHYVFTVWDKSLSNITEDTIVTAQFGEMDQEYTVRWFDGNGDEMTQYTVKVAAHETAIYTGRDLEDRGSGDATEYFMGWDKLTTNVVSNLDVYPRFIRPVLPDSKPSSYDYLYSDDPADDSAYSLAEFWGVMESANAAAYCSPFDKVKIVMPAGTSVISDNVIECVVGGFNRQYQVDKGAVGGVYLVMANLLNATHSMNSSNTNEGGWPASAMRNWLNLTVFPALPIQWRKMMKTCRIRSTAGNTSTDIVTSDDKLWLLSYTEVGFSTAAPYINEVHPDVYGQTATNAVLPIFTDNASRIKRIGGASGRASNWWLRSPRSTLVSEGWVVAYTGAPPSNSNVGGWISHCYPTTEYGVAFGFSI